MSASDLGGFGAGTAVLYLPAPNGDGRGGVDGDVCRALLSAEGPFVVLRIAYGVDPASPPAALRADVVAARTIAVGTDDGSTPGGNESVRTVRKPDDLRGIGVTAGECLGTLADTGFPIRACFDGIEDVLERTTFRTAFEFLHLLTHQLSDRDAVSHFHFDATGYDDRTVARIGSLFDVVVREDAGGAVRVDRG